MRTNLITVSSHKPGEAQTSSDHLLVRRRGPRAARPPAAETAAAQDPMPRYGRNSGFVQQNAQGRLPEPSQIHFRRRQHSFGTHGRAVLGQTNTFSAANSAFGSYWA